MIWKTEQPTVPGWYWWKQPPDLELQIVRVRWWIGYHERDSEFDRLRVYRMEIDDYANDLEDFNGHWAGPLEPPA